MRKLLILLTITLGILFTGCADKKVTTVKPYESFYTNQASNKKIIFNGVNDTRLLPIVSYIMKDKLVVAKFLMDQDIETWYNDAYIREFHASDLKLDQTQSDPKSTIVDIKIKELKAEYHKNILTEANLKGIVTLELVIKKNNKIVKKLINTTQSEFKISVRDASGFEDFIYSMMSDSISKSVNVIIETMKEL
jgi:hypothetical protein